MSTGLHRRGYKRLRVRRGADEVFRHTIQFATRASLRQRGVSFVGPMACETIDNNGYVLQLVGGAPERTVPAATNGRCDFTSNGHCTAERMQRILASGVFSQ